MSAVYSIDAVILEIEIPPAEGAFILDLTVTNKAVTGDVAYRHTDATSIATWGPRAAAVDLTVLDAGGSLARRAAALVDTFKDLAPVPLSVTFRRVHAPWAALLDLGDAVAVAHEGATYTARIAGITHDITADDWRIVLQLAKD